MGVTLYFNGVVYDEAAAARVVAKARAYAFERAWRPEGIAPRRGVAFLPHVWCDPFRLEIDDALGVWGFVKTQFAGPDVHIEIIGLLEKLQPDFMELTVEDEGGYWGTHDRARLAASLHEMQRRIEARAAEQPGAKLMVRRANGRIVDYAVPLRVSAPADEASRRCATPRSSAPPSATAE
jgi:hypothetical protein